jgi:hypothetical protein
VSGYVQYFVSVILNLIIVEFSRPEFCVIFLPTSFKVLHLVAYWKRRVGQASFLCAALCETATLGLTTRWGWCAPVDYRLLDYALYLV